MTPKIVIVAAFGRDHAIGQNNTLPWKIKREMQHFRRTTLNQTVLMGRKTAESIGAALKDRKNLVLTRSGKAPYPGQIAVSSIEEALTKTDGDSLMVIGGAEVYELCLPLADRLIISYIAVDVPNADAFFPTIDDAVFRMESAVPHRSDGDDPDFAIWTFNRIA